MIAREIENLLVKFLSRSANSSELDALHKWIENPENEPLFKEFVKVHFAITLGMTKADPSGIRKRLLAEIRKEKRLTRRRLMGTVMKYAAVAVLFVGLGYFLGNNPPEGSAQPLAESGEKKETITLELDDGSIVVLSEDGSSEITDSKGKVYGEQKGKKLVYDREQNAERLIYNTLTVPYGKRFDILLSDETHVFLNAGSSIKYPVHFLPEMKREVFLKGEAYFDVTHDEAHPFVVNAQELDVQVLGTSFNVANYPEDNAIEVVLVEGSVSLDAAEGNEHSEGPALLRPGFMGSFDKTRKEISSEKVNTALYTSWREGSIVFRNASFDNILTKLERHYNVVIVNNNSTLANESFNATIDVDKESFREVIELFKKVYDINYTIIDDKVIIN